MVPAAAASLLLLILRLRHFPGPYTKPPVFSWIGGDGDYFHVGEQCFFFPQLGESEGADGEYYDEKQGDGFVNLIEEWWW
jgi:hypothetical protein